MVGGTSKGGPVTDTVKHCFGDVFSFKCSPSVASWAKLDARTGNFTWKAPKLAAVATVNCTAY